LTVRTYARLAALMAGVVGLGIELTAERLLAPAFGTTIDLWSLIIGLTFAALSLGYSVGGRLIDHNPTHRFISFCLLAAGGWAILIALLGRSYVWWVQGWTFDFGGVTLGIFISVLSLFTVPPFLLGMVTPAAIRLTVPQVGEAGSSSGTIFALSTIGALIGTFIPVLVLLPQIGVRKTFLVIAGLGIASGALGLSLLVRQAAAGREGTENREQGTEWEKTEGPNVLP
jgi:MFS family permease